MYYGVDYLANIGPDLAFLDDLAFLRTRLVSSKAVSDPFLVEVTPDGIPMEEATTCDLRRGEWGGGEVGWGDGLAAAMQGGKAWHGRSMSRLV